MAKTVIEVRKNPNENNSSVLRRFSRRIQESGIIRKVKSSRYNIENQKQRVKKNGTEKRNRKTAQTGQDGVQVKIWKKNFPWQTRRGRSCPACLSPK
jgi:ribosomal protein S21